MPGKQNVLLHVYKTASRSRTVPDAPGREVTTMIDPLTLSALRLVALGVRRTSAYFDERHRRHIIQKWNEMTQDQQASYIKAADLYNQALRSCKFKRFWLDVLCLALGEGIFCLAISACFHQEDMTGHLVNGVLLLSLLGVLLWPLIAIALVKRWILS